MTFVYSYAVFYDVFNWFLNEVKNGEEKGRRGD